MRPSAVTHLRWLIITHQERSVQGMNKMQVFYKYTFESVPIILHSTFNNEHRSLYINTHKYTYKAYKCYNYSHRFFADTAQWQESTKWKKKEQIKQTFYYYFIRPGANTTQLPFYPQSCFQYWTYSKYSKWSSQTPFPMKVVWDGWQKGFLPAYFTF